MEYAIAAYVAFRLARFAGAKTREKMEKPEPPAKSGDELRREYFRTGCIAVAIVMVGMAAAFCSVRG